jgi:hypothetical protein
MTEVGSARERVKGPAIGLLVIGVLGVIASLYGVAQSLFGLGGAITAEQAQELQDAGMPEWAMGAMMGGSILFNVLGLAGSAFVAYAGLQMQKLRSHGLAQVASVLVMIPCVSSCCCIVGIPIGVWALIVLNKPEVRSSFT